MVKKWSVSYPAVNGVEQRRVYVYLPTMYEADPERRYPVPMVVPPSLMT